MLRILRQNILTRRSPSRWHVQIFFRFSLESSAWDALQGRSYRLEPFRRINRPFGWKLGRIWHPLFTLRHRCWSRWFPSSSRRVGNSPHGYRDGGPGSVRLRLQLSDKTSLTRWIIILEIRRILKYGVGVFAARGPESLFFHMMLLWLIYNLYCKDTAICFSRNLWPSKRPRSRLEGHHWQATER